METNSGAPAQASSHSKAPLPRPKLPKLVAAFLKQYKVSTEKINSLSDDQVKILSYSGVRYAIGSKLISLEEIGAKIRLAPVEGQRDKIILENDKTVTICGQEVELAKLLNTGDNNIKFLYTHPVKTKLTEKSWDINKYLEKDVSKVYAFGVGHAIEKELEKEARSAVIKDLPTEEKSSVIDSKKVAKAQENSNMPQEESAKKEKATDVSSELLAKPRLSLSRDELQLAIKEGLEIKKFIKATPHEENNCNSKTSKNVAEKLAKNNTVQGSDRGRS